MTSPTVFYCGSNATLLHTLRSSGGDSLRVEQIPDFFSLNLLAPEKVGLLVLQHEPPFSDGFAPLLHWQQSKPEVPVLVLTSDYTPGTTKRLMRSGAKEVLPLPLDVDDVLACYASFIPGFRESPVGIPAKPIATEKPDNQLTINYFGPMQIRWNGQSIDFNWQAKMLFGYLAYHAPKALSRDHLARVFWPEKQENQPESARRSLNVELNHIRRAIRQQTGGAQDMIVFDQNCYRLAFDGAIESDVLRFKGICQTIQGRQRRGEQVPNELFEQAVQAYSSHFLENCPEIGLNWVEVERQHLSALFEQIADQYSAQLCETGDLQRAVALCHDLLARDQRMETIHRRLMHCYGELGMCHKMEQQYRLLGHMLERAFQSKPSAETTRLYQQIKQAQQ